MRVVVSQNSFPVGLVERQAITNAVRDVAVGFDAPSLDLDPEAVALIDDRAIQIEQRFKAKVIPHALLYHQMIKDESESLFQ